MGVSEDNMTSEDQALLVAYLSPEIISFGSVLSSSRCLEFCACTKFLLNDGLMLLRLACVGLAMLELFRPRWDLRCLNRLERWLSWTWRWRHHG